MNRYKVDPEFAAEQEQVVKGWRSTVDESKRAAYLATLERRKRGVEPYYRLPDGRGFWPDGTIHK